MWYFVFVYFLTKCLLINFLCELARLLYMCINRIKKVFFWNTNLLSSASKQMLKVFTAQHVQMVRFWINFIDMKMKCGKVKWVKMRERKFLVASRRIRRNEKKKKTERKTTEIFDKLYWFTYPHSILLFYLYFWCLLAQKQHFLQFINTNFISNSTPIRFIYFGICVCVCYITETSRKWRYIVKIIFENDILQKIQHLNF